MPMAIVLTPLRSVVNALHTIAWNYITYEGASVRPFQRAADMLIKTTPVRQLKTRREVPQLNRAQAFRYDQPVFATLHPLQVSPQCAFRFLIGLSSIQPFTRIINLYTPSDIIS